MTDEERKAVVACRIENAVDILALGNKEQAIKAQFLRKRGNSFLLLK